MPDALLRDLAVVVVAYGRPDLLRDGLAPVAADLEPAQVVVVDNFSTADNRAEVVLLCDEQGWHGVYPSTNTGFGAGCNLGVEAALAAGARQVLLLNPDASIDRASVLRLLRAVLDDPEAVAAPLILRPDGRPWSAGADLDLRTGRMRSWLRRTDPPVAAPVPWVSGACMMLDESLWRRVGGFDDDYFLYWEDVDLCARVDRAGGRVVVVDGARAVHDQGGTHTPAGSRAKSPLYYYYNVRNRQVFASKWLDARGQRQWRRTAAGAALEVLLRGGRRQLLHPVAPVGAVLRGLWHGARYRSA